LLVAGWGIGSVAAQSEQPVEATSFLGQPLRRAEVPASVAVLLERNLAAARRGYAHTPEDPDSIIWLGRRLAYLGRHNEAIETYSKGIALHPNEPRLLRHRGHRYITIRRLGDAIRDLERADRLTRGRPDEIEPDGMPNARGIPTSTLKSNIRYHLGLAHYLEGDFAKAERCYREDVEAAVNPDMVVASSHWLYMALRRQGNPAAAAKVLEPISKDMPIIENGSYHRLLLLYKGLLPVDSIMVVGGTGDAVQDATTGYGVGNWHWYNGRESEARAIFQRIMGMAQWGAFGFIAAEADLARR
jgi:tetratricopeptide (TPR) repeat protein